ncbi:universal stress protein [Micromonospora auratinigra]|uniref:Nucleotide-binding universal stress protein, UspA family n=1 Tax=Micromonospora auratinigra TaxID=261654 RepID=A0A1A8Z7N5_9ACTN|nr:universal stress protein [Micromonospora auratinigra]SBT39842.1 Nucleotide-binding universal stress protein, UspA family [Micromonospora auratinigra]
METNRLIVVGVDGSDGGRRALDWAVGEATARGGAVQAVVAWRWDRIEVGPMTNATPPRDERQRAVEVLDDELRGLALRSGGGCPVAGEVVEGPAPDVLTAAARTADLLVLGSHGNSRLRHTVLGSVSEECVRKASCPVVVVPVPAPTTRTSTEPALRA